MEPYEDICRRGGSNAIRELDAFFAGRGPVHQTLYRLAQKCCELEIPYAVIGGMALNIHGYERATIDVDAIVTAEGLRKLHDSAIDGGYAPLLPASRHLRD